MNDFQDTVLSNLYRSSESTQIRLVAFGSTRALGAIQSVFEYAPQWLDQERFRLVPTVVLLDQFDRFHFQVPEDAEKDAARVIMADLSSLRGCRAMYSLCNGRDSSAQRFFRSFSLASVLLPNSDMKLGWDGFEGRARAAAALAMESLLCGNIVASDEAERPASAAAAWADYDALAAPVVAAYGRSDRLAWRPSWSARPRV